MNANVIEYYIADIGDTWGIYRDGSQIAVRHDAGDAIAFAHFFADREALTSGGAVRVMADAHMHRTLQHMQWAA
jgi:hypothetical protein